MAAIDDIGASGGSGIACAQIRLNAVAADPSGYNASVLHSMKDVFRWSGAQMIARDSMLGTVSLADGHDIAPGNNMTLSTAFIAGMQPADHKSIRRIATSDLGGIKNVALEFLVPFELEKPVAVDGFKTVAPEFLASLDLVELSVVDTMLRVIDTFARVKACRRAVCSHGHHVQDSRRGPCVRLAHQRRRQGGAGIHDAYHVHVLEDKIAKFSATTTSETCVFVLGFLFRVHSQSLRQCSNDVSEAELLMSSPMSQWRETSAAWRILSDLWSCSPSLRESVSRRSRTPEEETKNMHGLPLRNDMIEMMMMVIISMLMTMNVIISLSYSAVAVLIQARADEGGLDLVVCRWP